MTNKSFVAIVLCTLLSVFSVVGCADDSSSSSISNRCSVTSVVLGTMKVQVSTTTSSGTDTTYLTTISGSYTPMEINQQTQEIHNRDSLPLGTIVNRVAFSQFVADGVVALRTLSGIDSVYSTSDSVDCSTPRTFVVYSTDGTAKKEYTLRLNVHQQEGDEFTWWRVTSGNADLAALTEPRATVMQDGTLGVYGLYGGEPVLMNTELSESPEWSRLTLSGDVTGFEPRSVLQMGNCYYANADAGLLVSDDGLVWSVVEGGLPLVAVGSDSLYAISDDTIYCSHDGQNWIRNEVDTEEALPTADFMSVYVPSATYETYEDILLVGTRDGEPVVWKRNIDKQGYNTYAWTYYNPSKENTLTFPSLESTALVVYDDRILAFGLDDEGEFQYYISSDGGRTWRDSLTGYSFPVISDMTEVALTADDDNFIWLVCSGTGDVWRGRLNRLSWDEDDGIYERSLKR